jgi:hypothetical protein
LAKPFRSYVESRNLELHPLHWGSPQAFHCNPYIIQIIHIHLMMERCERNIIPKWWRLAQPGHRFKSVTRVLKAQRWRPAMHLLDLSLVFAFGFWMHLAFGETWRNDAKRSYLG